MQHHSLFWQTVWKRHARFCKDGTWDAVLIALQAEADARGEIDWNVSVGLPVSVRLVDDPRPGLLGLRGTRIGVQQPASVGGPTTPNAAATLSRTEQEITLPRLLRAGLVTTVDDRLCLHPDTAAALTPRASSHPPEREGPHS